MSNRIDPSSVGRGRDRPFVCSLAVAFLALVSLAAPSVAHVFWLEPSSYHVESGSRVGLSFREGHGAGHRIPRNESRLERFEVHGPGGVQAVPGANGLDPAGILPPPQDGFYVAGYSNTPAPHRLPAARFERYLVEEGLESVVAVRRQRGESDQPGVERFYRCAKSLFEVGEAGEEGETGNWAIPLGLTLELIPDNPYRLVAGDTLDLQLLFRGKPLAGALVVAVARDAADGAETSTVRQRSDRLGRVRLPLNATGRWLVKTVHMAPAPPEAQVDWESWWGSLTFAVGEGME